MKKFGLIGHPIEHSLSPALFKAGYNGRYAYDLIQTSDFEVAWQRFLDDYDGINVTAPFKELAFRKADLLAEECAKIGAANLLIKTPDGVKAYNSDFLGVRLWISEIASSMPELPSVLIVGLGGAGKAAAEAAKSLGCRTVHMNRTRYNDEIRPLEEFCLHFSEADIIIYNIPVAIPEISSLHSAAPGGKKHLLEANYKNPSFSKETLKEFQEHGLNIEYHAGQTWLLLQAVTGYEIFTGEKPDLSKMTEQI